MQEPKHRKQIKPNEKHNMSISPFKGSLGEAKADSSDAGGRCLRQPLRRDSTRTLCDQRHLEAPIFASNCSMCRVTIYFGFLFQGGSEFVGAVDF